MTDSPTPSRQYARPVAPIGHSGLTVGTYYGAHFLGAVFPIVAAITLFGWRALLCLLAVPVTAMVTSMLWRNIGLRGRQLHVGHVLWLSLLLAMMLPAELARGGDGWAMLVLAGAMLSILAWLLGAGRIHPAVVVYLSLFVFQTPLLSPRHVLQLNRMGRGDLLDAATIPEIEPSRQPWIHRPIVPGFDALYVAPAIEFLGSFTAGHMSPDRAWLSLESLVRDRLPPLEDFILGGHPAPLGLGSAIAVLIGGLFLLYRGLIDYRVPLLIVAVAFAALLLLPTPVVIGEHPEWRWLVGRVSGVGWPLAITLVNYEILASPLLFMAFFLATDPAVRPMSRRGRALYAGICGLLSALAMLYVSPMFGPYLALLLASLLTPSIDRWIRPNTLRVSPSAQVTI